MQGLLKLATVAIVIFTVLAMGCSNELQVGGNGDSNDSNGETHEIPDQALPAETFIASLCDAVWECASESRGVAAMSNGLGGRFLSVEDCKDGAGAEYGVGVDNPELEAAVDAGRLIVDRSQIDACISEFKELMCSDGEFFNPSLPPACRALFDGQQQEGQNCVDDLECSDALICNSSSVDGSCYGICETMEASDGEACGTETCDDSQFCDYDADPQVCRERYSAGMECMWDTQCQMGLECEEGNCVSFVLATLGDECHYGRDYCEPGTRCYVDKPAEVTPDFDRIGECAAIGEHGDDCLTESDCIVGLRCLFDDEEDFHGTCASRAALGEDCKYGSDCLEGFCDENSCTEHYAEGAACMASFQCESGTCIESGEDFVCGTQPELCEVPTN